ncbi:hypothetical protein RCL1_007270 [Eukaryota sp. TZLM3-RCL]
MCSRLQFFSGTPVLSRFSCDFGLLFNRSLLTYCTHSHILLLDSDTTSILSIFDCSIPLPEVSYHDSLIPNVPSYIHSVRFVHDQNGTTLPFLLVGLPSGQAFLLEIKPDYSIIKVSNFSINSKLPVICTGIFSSLFDSFFILLSTPTSSSLFSLSSSNVCSQLPLSISIGSELLESSLIFSSSPTSDSFFLSFGITSGDVLLVPYTPSPTPSPTPTQHPTMILKGHSSSCSVLSFYSFLLATGGADGSIYVYDCSELSNLKLPRTETILKNYSKSVVGLSFVNKSDQNYLIGLDISGNLIVYRSDLSSIGSWEIIGKYFLGFSTDDPLKFTTLASSFNGKILTVTREGSFIGKSLTLGHNRVIFDPFVVNGGHTGPITSIKLLKSQLIDTDSRPPLVILTSGADHVIRLWVKFKGQNLIEIARPLLHGHVISGVNFDPSNTLRILLTSFENAVRVLDPTIAVEILLSNVLNSKILPPLTDRPSRQCAAELQPLGLSTRVCKRDLTLISDLSTPPDHSILNSYSLFLEASRIPGRATADVACAVIVKPGIILVGHADGWLSLHRLGKSTEADEDRYYLIGDCAVGQKKVDSIISVSSFSRYALAVTNTNLFVLSDLSKLPGFVVDSVDSDYQSQYLDLNYLSIPFSLSLGSKIFTINFSLGFLVLVDSILFSITIENDLPCVKLLHSHSEVLTCCCVYENSLFIGTGMGSILHAKVSPFLEFSIISEFKLNSSLITSIDCYSFNNSVVTVVYSSNNGSFGVVDFNTNGGFSENNGVVYCS